MRFTTKMMGLAILAVPIVTASPAAAQLACAQRDEIITALQQSHAEVPVARGLASNGMIIEVLASESGSFTVLLTRPNGISCLITVGEYWEVFESRAPAELPGQEL